MLHFHLESLHSLSHCRDVAQLISQLRARLIPFPLITEQLCFVYYHHSSMPTDKLPKLDSLTRV